MTKKTMLCLLTLMLKNPSVQSMTKSASPTGSKNMEKGPVRGPFFYSIIPDICRPKLTLDTKVGRFLLFARISLQFQPDRGFRHMVELEQKMTSWVEPFDEQTVQNPVFDGSP